MHSLPVFWTLADRPVILIGTGEAAQAKRRLLERAGARITDDIEAPAVLAVVATDAPEDAVARLRARGIPVNTVDRPDLCDLILPAIVDRDPLLIAIGTGGASAGLAKALRQRLEALLPANAGALATALAHARAAMRARWPDAARRRRAIDAALAPGAPLDPLDDAAPTRVADWLAAPDGEAEAHGTLHHIRLTSDDPDDLTLRQARWLAECDALWHAPGVPVSILSRARADAARHRADQPPAPPAHERWVWVERAP